MLPWHLSAFPVLLGLPKKAGYRLLFLWSYKLFPLTELPSPSLGPIAEMRDSCMKLFRATRPTELGYTYEELKSMDEISVTLIPEKKGVVFKHVEYLVESKVKDGRDDDGVVQGKIFPPPSLSLSLVFSLPLPNRT